MGNKRCNKDLVRVKVDEKVGITAATEKPIKNVNELCCSHVFQSMQVGSD